MKVIKRPVVIDAFQATAENMSDKTIWPEWLKDAWGQHIWESANTPSLPLRVRTLDGIVHLKEGDWIMRGVGGEFYPHDKELFSRVYMPVSESAPQQGRDIDLYVIASLDYELLPDALQILPDVLFNGSGVFSFAIGGEQFGEIFRVEDMNQQQMVHLFHNMLRVISSNICNRARERDS